MLLASLMELFPFNYPPVGVADIPNDLHTLEYVEVTVS